MLKKAEKQKPRWLWIKKAIKFKYLCFIFVIVGGCFQLAQASVVKDFETEGDAWINDVGKDGLTKLDLVIKDDSPIRINFDGTVSPNYQNERFSFFILTKIGEGLSNLHFRWEKEQIDLKDAPEDLGFQYLTREPSSSTVSQVNSGADFHELWFDFSNDINSGGAITLNFTWDDFNLPEVAPYSLIIGINESELTKPVVSNVPLPAAIWFFATGILSLLFRKQNKY